MKRLTKLIIIIVIASVCCNCAPSTKMAEITYTKDVTIVDSVDVDTVWAANSVSFDLRTVGDKQFVAYYDKDRMMTVASRSIGSDVWVKKTLPNQLHWDSHNYVVLGIDKSGYIHVSGNMHVNPLAYFRSTEPLDVSTIVEVNNMVGELEDSVTYPKFFYDKNDELYFSYRAGTCGNGNILVNRFDTAEGKWLRHLSEPLFEGREKDGDRAAYHQLTMDADGNFHYAWVWRWTPLVETTHQLCYATSPDLLNWKNAAGQTVDLPFRPDDQRLIVDPVQTKGGLHNGKFRIIITPDQKPLLGYLKYDEDILTQLYLANFADGKWNTQKISDWDFRWEFVGGGDQMTSGATFSFDGFSSDGLLAMSWSNQTGKSGQYVIDPVTLKSVNKSIAIMPKYPNNINDRISDNPELHVNLQGDTEVTSDGSSYVLKWESKGKSHGKHAPEVIPAEPVSRLILLNIK